MSRAGASLLVERNESSTQYKLSPQKLFVTKWTEQIDALNTQDELYRPDSFSAVASEIYDTLDSQARIMAASVHEIVQCMSQATVTSIQLIYASTFTQRLQTQDIWIEMPPFSVKNVVMNVQCMGRGEPLAFPTEFLEE